jgi:small conductance mechanosensitive channel
MITAQELSDELTESASNGLSVLLIVVGTVVVILTLRPLARFSIRRLVRRAVKGKRTRWRVRTRRVSELEPLVVERRRQQRIEAGAAMLSRMVSIIVVSIGAIAVLHQLDVDPALALGGAGFLGAALAFGGQHSVNDFITGMQVLFEDRCGEGDLIRLRLHDQDVVGTVTWLGAFSARVESEDATIHLSNRELSNVVNLSQRGVSTSIELNVLSSVAPGAGVEASLVRAYEETPGFDALVDGLIVAGQRREGSNLTVTIRSVRPLTELQRDVLKRCEI